jgi:hypothetical protein
MPQDDQNKQVDLNEWERLTFEKYGVPENLRRSIVGQESGGDTGAVSPTGVKGRYQVTQATAKQYGYDRDDPWQQPVAAAKHLRSLYDGVRQRHPDFDDKTAWLGASAEYYYGGNAFDARGNLSEESRDGFSTPAKYARGVAEKWSALDKGQATQSTAADLMSRGLLPGMKEPVSAPARPSTARGLGITPAEGMNFDLRGGAPSVGQSYWDLPPEEARKLLEGRYKAGKEQARQEQVRQEVANDFIGQRYVEAFGRGGLALSKMARQTIEGQKALTKRAPTLGLMTGSVGSMLLPDSALEAWRQGEEQAMRYAREKQAARPSSLTTDVAEGILEGAPSAAAAIGGAMLTGGGLPAAMALGGGMGAAGADWNDPRRAALQTGIGAVAPVVGGKIGSKVGEAVASRLANPTLQTGARVAGELGGGGLGNVLGKTAETGIFEGRLPTGREVAKEALIGAALNAPGAYTSGGAARAARPVTEPLSAAPDVAGTPAIAGLPPGVKIVRPEKGEQIPARARAERQIPMSITNPDGSVENVLVVAPRGVNESQLRPQIEQALQQPTEQTPAGPVPTFDDVIADSQARIAQSLKAGDTNAADVELSVINQTIKDQYSDAIKAAGNNPAARAAAQRIRAQQQRLADRLKTQAKARVGELSQPTEPLPAEPSIPTAPLTENMTAPTQDLTGRLRGAIPLGPSPLVRGNLLGPASTQRLPGKYAGAEAGQETQQIPGVSRTPRIEDEPTADLTALTLLRRQAEQALQPAVQQSALRQTAEIPREQSQPTVNTLEPQQPQPLGAGRLIGGVSRTGQTAPVFPPTRVPKATDQNIAELEARYEQLGRLQSDRGQRLTGDMASEQQELGAEIMRYRNERQHAGETEPMSSTIGGREKPMTPEEKAQRRAALQPRPRTSGLLQATTLGRPVTQEVQIPSALNPTKDFYSREDARRGHFDTLTDTELLAEIRRLEDAQNQAVGGRSKLTPRELEANRFDLKIAVEQQKERGAVQRAQGRDAANRIANRTPGQKLRVIQHERFGEVTESPNQKGAARGQLRVTDTGGAEHVIQNPRTRGNRGASFVKPQGQKVPTESLIVPPPKDEGPIPDTAMPEIVEQRQRRLAAAIGKSAEDQDMVQVANLGLQSKRAPVRPASARARQKNVSLDAITLGRDNLSKGRMYQVQEALRGGVKPPKRGVPLARGVEPIVLVPDPQRPGKYIVSDDGNHRVALLKLQGFKGEIPATVYEAPAGRKAAPEPAKAAARFMKGTRSQTQFEGQSAEYTGKTDLYSGRTVYEVEIIEGRNKGKTRWIRTAPKPRGKQGFSIGALPDESSGGTVLGSLGGGLQGLFSKRGRPKANPTKADIETAGLGSVLGKYARGLGNEMRTALTVLDFGAPLAQGAWFTISHPTKAPDAFAKMFRSLSRSQSDAINTEIAFHPMRKLWEKSGLHVATEAQIKGSKAGGEEAYEGVLAKAPGIRGFERAYRTYLDTMRVSVWESYVKSLQRQGITFDNNPKAYKDAASFINIATGRGQLKRGGMLDKASDLLGSTIFAPRNLVANFQILDPVRYAKMEPAARKLALRDSLTTIGAMVATAALLRQAGVSVGFNILDDDFMIARAGNTRYDLTFGKKSQVQFLARLIAATYNGARGEGNLPNKDALSVAKKFAESKASPLLSAALTIGEGETYEGRKLSDMSTAEKIWEMIPVPILAKDLIDVYREEGKAGVVKTLPAIFGARVNTYPDRAKSDFMSTPAELRAEQKKFGQTRSFLTPKRGEEAAPPAAKPVMDQVRDIFRYQGPKPLEPGKETPAQFASRKARVDEWNTKYGLELVRSSIYNSATPDEQKAALDKLKEAITAQSDEKRPHLYLLSPGAILRSVRESARNKRRNAGR